MFQLLLVFILVLMQQAPVITADNVTALQSIKTVDFEGLDDEILSGWFALSPDGQHIAVPHSGGGLVIWNVEGELLDITSVTGPDGEAGTLLDADFSLDGEQIAAIYTDGTTYSIHLYDLDGQLEILDFDPEYGRPVR